MTKAEIVDNVYDRVGGFSKREAAEVVETVFELMKEALVLGDRVKVSGFGKFVVRAKKERVGRDPQTGERTTIAARRVLRFYASDKLKGALNPHRLARAARDI